MCGDVPVLLEMRGFAGGMCAVVQWIERWTPTHCNDDPTMCWRPGWRCSGGSDMSDLQCALLIWIAAATIDTAALERMAENVVSTSLPGRGSARVRCFSV